MYLKDRGSRRNIFTSGDENEWSQRKNICIDRSIIDEGRSVIIEDNIRKSLVTGSLGSEKKAEAEEENVRECDKVECDRVECDKVVIISSWKIKCGIAIYTEDLLKSLEEIDNRKWAGRFVVHPIEYTDEKNIKGKLTGKLTHLQHEFGIMPYPPDGDYRYGPVIMTFHTIPSNIGDVIQRFENSLNIVAYIVPCSGALRYMRGVSKDVIVIPLGSKIMKDDINGGITKAEARERLGIGIGRIGFVFGFQSSSKGYDRLIEAAYRTGIHLIISGSVHFSGYRYNNISSYDKVTFLNRHLNDEEIDLYSLASDILLFDYAPQNHYSCSATLHRTVGAGRPVICVNTNHFSELEDEKECLKYNNLDELERHIRRVLESNSEYEILSKGALEFAKRTSSEVAARKHVEIYKKHGGLD